MFLMLEMFYFVRVGKNLFLEMVSKIMLWHNFEWKGSVTNFANYYQIFDHITNFLPFFWEESIFLNLVS